MKKILLSCACCLLAVGLLAGCDEDVEDVNPEDPNAGVVTPGDDDGEPGETIYKLGALDTTTYEYVYFSGEASGNYLGVTSSWDEAAPVTFEEVTSEKEGFIAVSISFVDAEGATKYISWSDSTKVDIADEPYAWYWVEENTVFAAGSSEGRALVYYAKDPSFRAYAQNESNLANPHVRVYTAEPEVPEAPEPIEPVLGTVTEGTYFLGVTMSEVTYYFDGTLSGYYGSVSSNGYDAAVVTVAAATDGYTLSIGESDDTQYLYAYVASGYVDLGLQSDPFTWQYDETFCTFVIKLNDQWNFLGTYSTNVRIGLSDYGYLTGDTATSYAQYPAKLFDVITYNAPESVTISGAEESQSLEEGETLQLSATVSGTDPVNGKITWTSGDDMAATVSSTGLVTAKTPTESVTITATSAVNASAYASVTLTITAKAQGPVIADWQDTYEADATYKLAFTYNNSLHYVTGLDAGGDYTYEGLTSTSFVVGADISVAKVESGADNEYYLTYTFDEETYYITITTDDSKGLSFTTTKSSIFYNATYNCWCNSALSYYLGAYYVSSTNYVWLEATDISKIAGTSTLPAELYKWTGEDYGDYEIVDFDTMSSTGVTDSSNDSYTTLVGTTLETLDTCKITWDSGSGNNSSNTRVNSNHYIQVYGGESITLELKDGYAITRIELACSASSAQTFSVAIDSGEASTEGTTVEGDLVTITGIEEALSMVLKNTSTSQSRITDIVFYYTYTEA